MHSAASEHAEPLFASERFFLRFSFASHFFCCVRVYLFAFILKPLLGTAALVKLASLATSATSTTSAA